VRLKIKIDEDLPKALAVLLREVGYEEVRTVHEQGMGGWKDPVLFQAIQEEGRFLITADKGFANLRIHPPGSHAGILLLRPDKDGIGPLLELCQQVLASTELSSLEGCLAVANPQGLRIRRG
jgi:predicted nuclease of predicted toxin-antitoxin system